MYWEKDRGCDQTKSLEVNSEGHVHGFEFYLNEGNREVPT